MLVTYVFMLAGSSDVSIRISMQKGFSILQNKCERRYLNVLQPDKSLEQNVYCTDKLYRINLFLKNDKFWG